MQPSYEILRSAFAQRGFGLLRSKESNGAESYTATWGLVWRPLDDTQEALELLAEIGGSID